MDDIGVMAPYRLQVRKLRKLLRSRGLGGIRVGTVDDYQGQEERIIFISTVVTSKALMTSDNKNKHYYNGNSDIENTSLKHVNIDNGDNAEGSLSFDYNEMKPQSTSFLCSSKRFNVAITRARAMLVVVGHPIALQCDGNWLALMKFCYDNGTFNGAGIDSMAEGFQKMNHNDSDDHTKDGSSYFDESERFEDERQYALDDIFPESLDDIYEYEYGDNEFFADDLVSRVMM